MSGEVKTVPVEATEAMLVTGREALLPLIRLTSYAPLIGVWNDMLAAAPSTQPGPRTEGEAVAWRYRHPNDEAWQLTQDHDQAFKNTGEVEPLGVIPFASPLQAVSAEDVARVIDPAVFMFERGELDDKVWSSSRAVVLEKAARIIALLRPLDDQGEAS